MAKTINAPKTSPAFVLGYKSAKLGKLPADNPYSGTDARESWIKGFRSFEKDIRSIRK